MKYKDLIKKNYDANGKNLAQLAASGDLEGVKQLVEKGTCLDIRDSKTERTALMEASIQGNYGIVDYLIRKGANLDLECDKEGGETALTYAIDHGHKELAKLIAKNAKVDGLAIMRAAFEKFNDIVDILIKKGNKDQVNWKDFEPDGIPLIMHLAYHGHINGVKKIIDSYSDINLRDDENYTILMCAVEGSQKVKGDHKDIIKLIFEYNPNPNLENSDGQTALDIANKGTDPEITKLLEGYKQQKNRNGHLSKNNMFSGNPFSGGVFPTSQLTNKESDQSKKCKLNQQSSSQEERKENSSENTYSP